jgi:pyruvate/2-oxoglutarate dehydrogenase complex dihydrolipoamide dehydrogenase (E3) component
MPDYDVIVLGGGSAGSSAAAAAHAAGARTAMINDGELGGLCILRGCMPTKAMLATAHAVHEAGHLEPFGARLEGGIYLDFAAVMARKDEQVARFKKAKVDGITAAGYEVIDGRGRFSAEGGIEIGGRRLTASRYVIATGSYPARPPIPGLDRVPVLSSDDVMRLQAQPRTLIVQGAGPIGLELGQFFARIGTCVTFVNRSPLLYRLDPACGAELQRALADEPRFEAVVPGRIEAVAPRGSGLVATLDNGSASWEVEADALLLATGRRAALDDLGLEQVGVDVSDGIVPHDDAMTTSNPDIFVAGDATGADQILHIANQEGRAAGHNAAVGAPERRVDRRLMMQVVFTDPPFALVGRPEKALRADDAGLAVGEARFPETGRAITMGARHGLWRLFANGRGEIAGSAILGPRADDLAHLVMLMMRYGSKVDEIPELPWYHPTLSEVMLDLARSLRRARDR